MDRHEREELDRHIAGEDEPGTAVIVWEMLVPPGGGDGIPRDVAERAVGKDEVRRWIDRGEAVVERRSKVVPA